MKTRLWPVVSLLVILSMVLAACGAGAAQPTTPAAPAKITIFVGFGAGSDPDSMTKLNALADEYNKSHTDTQIEFVFSTWEEHASKFSTMIAGDLAPDMAFPIGIQGLAEFPDEWIDVAPYLQKDNYDTSDFYGPAVQLTKFPDKTVGLPIGVYPSVMFYNEDLFDKAGLSYPPKAFGDPNWTYANLAETAKKLTLDANGDTADSPDFDPAQVDQWGWGGFCGPFRTVPAKFGSSALGMDAAMKEAQMNTGGYLEGMQYIADTIWNTHVQPNQEQLDSSFGGADNPFEGGHTAMWECFSWMAYAFDTFQEAFNWNVAPVPAGPQGDVVSPTNADTFGISKHSKNPEQAWEVAKWLMAPEQLGRLCGIFGCLPARKSLADGWMSDMKAKYPQVDFQQFIDAIAYMDSSPNNETWVPNYSKVWDATENALSTVRSGADKDVQHVMDGLDTEVQGYLDEYWATK
jgi:multiple sugar transport system substrate-binding protein